VDEGGKLSFQKISSSQPIPAIETTLSCPLSAIEKIQPGFPGKNSPQFLWNGLLDLLRNRIPETAFNTWFAHLSIADMESGRIVVGVPNTFVLEYVEHHYKSVLEAAVSEILGTFLPVSFTIKPAAIAEAFHPDASEKNPASSVHVKSTVTVNATVPLYAGNTFEDFVIGDCNQLAHAACMAVAESPGRNKFNPLVLYGGTGMGKTHLLQAIAHFCLENETVRKIVYRTSEEFTREYIEFVQRNKDSRAFYKLYKDADILLLDDIQFLAGKPGTQDEFFNIFSALQSFNRQIVITSDRPPAQIQGLHTRLLSRFDTGFLADLQPPNLETRLAILQKKAAMDPGSCVDEDVLAYVAGHVTSSVRELEGTLIKLSAYADFIHAPITVSIAKEILGDTVRNHNRGVALKSIIQAVATEFGIPHALLTSQTRKKNVAEPRHAAMYLARQLTDNSLYTIGLAFNRDYSTAIHSIKRTEQVMETDPAFRTRIEKIRAQLG
jgi:chromosomal replication initiator protein